MSNPTEPTNLQKVLGTQALASVIAERCKQIQRWGNAHDDDHADAELASAAAVLIVPGYQEVIGSMSRPIPAWALDLRAKHPRREQLVTGIALALAELERLDRS